MNINNIIGQRSIILSNSNPPPQTPQPTPEKASVPNLLLITLSHVQHVILNLPILQVGLCSTI